MTKTSRLGRLWAFHCPNIMLLGRPGPGSCNFPFVPLQTLTSYDNFPACRVKARVRWFPNSQSTIEIWKKFNSIQMIRRKNFSSFFFFGEKSRSPSSIKFKILMTGHKPLWRLAAANSITSFWKLYCQRSSYVVITSLIVLVISLIFSWFCGTRLRSRINY